ncbi:TPA: GrpB family protein, partial [Legionella pneumophila]
MSVKQEQCLIKVVSYDSNWPVQFEQEAERIKKALGSNCIEIHHIGSTSVP